MKKIKQWDIVVGIHKGRAEIGEVRDVDTVHKLGSNGFKAKKYAYHVKYCGATEGFYLNARNLKKLNEWQADRIKKVLSF